MPSLREIQIGFRDAVFRGADAAFAPHLAAGRLAAEASLDIYRANAFGNLADALGAIFPVVRKLVGDEFFRYAAREYITRHPSTSGDLNDYGAALSGFLAGFPAAAALAYLPDTARLEWLVHEAYLAADHEPLAAERLATMAPERYPQLRFVLHPAVRLFASDFPVHRIWQVNQDDYTGDQTVDLSLGGIRLFVRRGRGAIQLEPLESGAWAFLGAIAPEISFAEVCGAALRADPGFEVGPFLQRLVSDGVIVDCTLT